MIAVRVGEAWRCACVWTTKAITEANTAVMTTAKSTGASGIRRKEKSPSPASAGTGASMAHTSATTPSCTADRTTGSSRSANRAVANTCAAKATAHVLATARFADREDPVVLAAVQLGVVALV